ncbi:F-box and associated interaction domains-containing protein [Raphanus sativus]|uniref:F-box/kelch-repeat protein At3g22730 n=1 Tax=Raphanus sativus TaxID=3726 RepID=A0A6J0LID2_RAPSA|nr:putative F-box/kelch-repeat protein At3g22730 [Raphanus sativus]KAJ4887126.1 F-box and associated interaction domains-containing protein [Raphanus sativus]
MSYLPADLVEEILSRVPAKSLLRLRSTCKGWNTLFKDQRFIEKHLRNVPKQLRALILEGCRLYPTSVDLNSVPPSIEFSDSLSLNESDDSEEVYIDTVFHCDGLLLCTTVEDELVVWNPCLRETRWIKQTYGTRCFYNKMFRGRKTTFALGYEKNQFCRSYKILMFWGCDKTKGDLVDGHEIYDFNNLHDDEVDGFEIYDLNSNSWRVVKAPNCFVMNSHGVSLKGNTYWVTSDDGIDDDYLLSFDFTKERFIRLCFPLPSLDCMYKALSVVREELSVLRCIKGSSTMEMWVTNKMDTSCEADLSWSKSFAVDYGLDVYTCLLIDERKKVALCDSYFGKGWSRVCTVGEADEYYTEIPFKEMYLERIHIFNYVPSLVHIQQDIESDVFDKSHRRRWDDLSREDDSDMDSGLEETDGMDSGLEEWYWWEIEGADISISRRSRGRVWKTR